MRDAAASISNGVWTRTFSYDEDGHLVSDSLATEAGTLAWTCSDHEAGVFGKASSSDGAVLHQRVVEKNEEGLPTLVERTREGSSETRTYRIAYTEAGGIGSVVIETDGRRTGSVAFSDEGYLREANGVEYDRVDQDERIKELAFAGDAGDTPVATYTYDRQGRLDSMHLVGYGMRYAFSYDGNATTPDVCAVTSDAGTAVDSLTLAYREITATAWSEALERTPHAVDVLNDPTDSPYAYSLTGVEGVVVAD